MTKDLVQSVIFRTNSMAPKAVDFGAEQNQFIDKGFQSHLQKSLEIRHRSEVQERVTDRVNDKPGAANLNQKDKPANLSKANNDLKNYRLAEQSDQETSELQKPTETVPSEVLESSGQDTEVSDEIENNSEAMTLDSDNVVIANGLVHAGIALSAQLMAMDGGGDNENSKASSSLTNQPDTNHGLGGLISNDEAQSPLLLGGSAQALDTQELSNIEIAKAKQAANSSELQSAKPIETPQLSNSASNDASLNPLESAGPISPAAPSLSDQMASNSIADHNNTASSSAMSLRAQEATNQLSMTIAKRLGAGETRFQIELFPADLGRVDIDLILSKTGQTQVNLRFAEAESARLFQGSEAQIQKALLGLGLDLSQAQIKIEGLDQAFSEAQGGSEANAGRLPTQQALAHNGFGQSGQGFGAQDQGPDAMGQADNGLDLSSGFDQPHQGSKDHNQGGAEQNLGALPLNVSLDLDGETSEIISLTLSEQKIITQAAQMFQGMNARAQALFEAAHGGSGQSSSIYVKV